MSAAPILYYSAPGQPVVHCNDSLLRGDIFVYRFGGVARPGMWAQCVNFHGGHLHMQCVVDDFGNLVPVDVAGWLPGRAALNYASEEQ